MTWPAWLNRVLPYLGRRQSREDLQEELRLHMEFERERQRDAGATETEARRSARRRLGSIVVIREDVDAVWGWRWLDDLGRDLRHAVRGLRRSPGVTATVVIVLAVGIGANTAMFSIVYGMLLRPLPYPDADAIVRVGHVSAAHPGSPAVLSNITFPRIQADAESFEYLAAYTPRSLTWIGPDGPRTLRGAMVSPSLFPLLRAKPHVGRLFTEEEAREGADRVALLSHDTWTNRFVSDPGIIGAPLELDGEPFIVVGVLAEGFSFPSAEEELWTPWAISPFEPAESAVPVAFAFTALGRLRPGVSPERAATEIRTILQRPAAGRSSAVRPPEEGQPSGSRAELNPRVIPLQDDMVRGYRPALLLLTAATTLVLLIACVNVAGLLLARGIARQRELAVRAALGAERSRIVRQLLAESVLLSVAGGGIGCAAAALMLRGASTLAPGDVPRLDEVNVDGIVLAFSLGLSMFVGLVFGTAPALQWSRLYLMRTLREERARLSGGFRILRVNQAQASLVLAQVALAMVLLVGAGLLLRSFVQLLSADRGYTAANVLTARVSNPDLRGLFSSGAINFEERNTANRRFYDALLDRLARMESLPGVEAVGLSSAVPLTDWRSSTTVRVPGRHISSRPQDALQAHVQLASPGYFDVMQLRLRGGRVFTPLDGASAPRVVVVNETLEREVFSGEPAVGQRLLVGADGDPWEVVGVVADVTYQNPAAHVSSAEVYVPVHQSAVSSIPILNVPFVSIRTTGNPVEAIPYLREAVADVHLRTPLENVMTMEAHLSSSIAEPRFYAVFVGLFAVVALSLAALGVYGLISYTFAQRRAEIGIRRALGAQAGHIVALVIKRGVMLIASGVGLGLLAAAAATRILERFLFGVSPVDARTLVGGTILLLAVGLFACWLPARRATQVDPAETLRFE